jgi:hypothetical protein
MSQHYLQFFEECWKEAGARWSFSAATGTPGVRLSKLKRWLIGQSEQDQTAQTSRCSQLRLRGVVVHLDPAMINSVVQSAYVDGGSTMQKVSTWAVKVGEHVVSPKWLVSKLTNMAPSTFHSHEAIRALRSSGFNVYQVEK